MRDNPLYSVSGNLLAIVMLLMMLAGCRSVIVGGVDVTNLDPNVHPPRRRVYVTDEPRAKAPPVETEAVEQEPAPDEPSYFDEPETTEAAGESMRARGSSEGRIPQAGDGREHIYIDKNSGPVTISRHKVYHWVREGGELVLSTRGGTVNVASGATGYPEPVPVIEGEAPDTRALFKVDEVIDLVLQYESAMRSRDSTKLGGIFTDDADFSFRMKVPREGTTLSEKYTLGQFTDTHRKGWRVRMDYEFTVRDIKVSVSDDGTTAVADTQVAEIMTAKGNRVSADYKLTFFVEKMGQKLLVTGLKAVGEMEATPATESR